ncbi:MAG: AAA family ATPase [bacterium]
MKSIVATGRGGAGKTSFIALLAKYLRPQNSLLLVDADPDENLAEMIGVNLEEEKVKTISSVLFDIQKGEVPEELKSLPRPNQIEYMFHTCLYEGTGFDLFSLGTKWTDGCYCQPNNILKSIIPKLSRNYDYTLIDSPAGLEHLNRKIMPEVNDIFAIVDPSRKSFDNLKRVSRILEEIGIKYDNFYVVANYKFSQNMRGLIEKRTELKYLGKINYDKSLEEYTFNGKSLLDLPENSPAYVSVKKIMENIDQKEKET